jgi:hypothetical protein
LASENPLKIKGFSGFVLDRQGLVGGSSLVEIRQRAR